MTGSAPRLADLQRAFQAFLLGRGDALGPAVRDGRHAGRTILLDVYRDAYALRLIEALTTDYPGLMAMAGPADFDHLARAYIAARPSRHPSVRWFGRELADFMACTPPYDRSAAAVEMARFEWALGEAFDGPDARPLRADQVTALPPQAWETLRFEPLPTLRRLTLTYAVPQAWQRREQVPPGDLEVEQEPAAVEWAVWRPELVSSFRSLEADEAVMLDALAAGRTFPELCEAIASQVAEEQVPARAASLLRAWVEVGMIAACRS